MVFRMGTDPPLPDFSWDVAGCVREQRLAYAGGAPSPAPEDAPYAGGCRHCHVAATIGAVIAACQRSVRRLEDYNVVAGAHIHKDRVLQQQE